MRHFQLASTYASMPFFVAARPPLSAFELSSLAGAGNGSLVDMSEHFQSLSDVYVMPRNRGLRLLAAGFRMGKNSSDSPGRSTYDGISSFSLTDKGGAPLVLGTY